MDRVAWEKDTFIRLQNEDPLLRELRKEAIACSNLESSAACRFKVNDDGLLVLKAVTPPLAPAVRTRKRKRNRALPSWAKKDRIVVPETLKAFVLYLHHGLPLSGHQGRTRTLASISERFWWSGLSKDVRRWVRSCVPCLRRKSPRPLRSGLAQTMAVTHPAHTFAIDLVGPCPETAEGDVWILTIIDVFTRWPIAIPLPNRKATTIQRALYERLFSVFGFPVRLLSDRGKEFIDGGLHSLCAWLGIQKIATTGYQPQANGHIERFHRYLNSSMTSLASGNITKWSFYIPAILFSYRVSVCESSGFSPFFLTYGRHPSLPSDLLLGLSQPQLTDEHSYATSLATALSQAYEYARSKQLACADRNLRRLNTSRKEVTFSNGQQVFYWFDKSSEKTEGLAHGPYRVTIPEKWRSWWQGPYTITSTLSNKLYVIDVGGVPTTVNVNRLLSVPAWNSYISDTSPSDHWTVGSSLQPSADPCQGLVEQTAPLREARTGDLAVWPLAPSKDNPLPFGLGKIMSINSDGSVVLQWYGNFAMNIHSTFKPCWFQKSTNQIYYASASAHPSHPPHFTDETHTSVLLSDLVTYGFALLDNDRLPTAVLRSIIAHEDVDSSSLSETFSS